VLIGGRIAIALIVAGAALACDNSGWKDYQARIFARKKAAQAAVQDATRKRATVLTSSPLPGSVTIDIGVLAKAGGLAVQRDGTIVLAAAAAESNGPTALVRVTPLGRLADPGITVMEGSVNAITVGSDDTIVAVGQEYTAERENDFLVARFLADGRPDTGFAHKGWTVTDVGNRKDHDIANAVAVQQDGKIVVAGESLVSCFMCLSRAYSFATVRYQRDGSLDRGFGDDGRVITRMGAAREDHASAVLVAPDGKIIVAGQADARDPSDSQGNFAGYHREFAVVRYLPNGKPDHQFGQAGKAKLLGIKSAAYAIATDAQGRIVVGGRKFENGRARMNASGQGFRTPLLVARYRSDGTVDESFGSTGIFALEQAPAYQTVAGQVVYGDERTSLAVQPGGKIIAAGGFLHVVQGKLIAAESLLQPGLGILFRISSDGSLDQSFDKQGLSFRADDLAVQPDGKLLLAGATRGKIILARLNSDGSPDRGFDGQGR
jgi:uncharacterized delta-60 repeat protein